MSNKVKKMLRLERGASRLLNVGYGNLIAIEKVVAIIEASSLPSKRRREQAAQENLLLDGTAGRKTRSLIVTDSNHVVLSALTPQSLQDRLEMGDKLPKSRAEIEVEEGEFVS